ncbi:GDP-mannose transporter [Fomitiporia mediterranea MF3/22]|uniref:GDP-mannose transporter n=1 Tax=Fomitiporia mediterranea (strain MF3/22) TaxID=694068 RepID=UPI0004408A3D|nr:GDP-mannose transporter [Fomitiporia mediterranea MF3/22]EJD07538.1 GDP-mannose transporter [Fomitiporia mediterranea MF3/22]
MSGPTPQRSPSASYKQLPQDERGEEDMAQYKKALATGASSKEGVSTAVLPIVSYCCASILMTVVNKFVVSGRDFSMNFLLLTIQSTVCVACVMVVKKAGIISFRDFDMEDAKKWSPISLLLVSVIYTGSKSIQYLSIPVYTIFKNLTIILIAYGEVIWFGGRVTGLTFLSFIIMVISSIIAAWSDIANALDTTWSSQDPAAAIGGLHAVQSALTKLNIGYFWMFFNCITSAAFVLSMRKRIKVMNFGDWETMFYNNLLSIPVLIVFSFLVEDWSSENLTKSFPPETRTFLLFAIAFSGAAAVGISFTTAWCIRATSSTTYSMVGALNKLPVAASGMLFFGDLVTLGSVSAVLVGFLAGVVYAVAKNNQKKAESARKQADSIIPLTQRKP